jgi:DNA-binding MarR family transcriptional regulator
MRMARYTEMFTELVRAEIELWNALDAHLQVTTGVTLAQFQALSAVRANEGAARVHEISAEMSITVGATSKVVDRLERDGFAVRTAHPSDRRSSLVSLTEHGSTALAKADEAAETHLGAVLGERFSDDDAERFLSDLRGLRSGTSEQVTA